MASNRARGKAFEKRIADYLVSIGWQVQRAPSQAKFIGPGRFVCVASDFFGALDIIAIHPKQMFTLCIQATLHSGIGKKKKDLESVTWNLVAQRVQIWQKTESLRGGVRVLVKNNDAPDGWEEHIFRLVDGSWPAEGILGDYRPL